jgi:PAS domain S-box-containing protein
MQIYSNSSKFTDGATPSEADSFLLNSEETYKNLVANIPGAIYRCIWDLSEPTAGKRRMAFLSEAIQEISGYRASDFVNDRVRDFASIIHPQDRKNVEALLLQSVVSKTPYILEYRIVRHDGGISWVYEKGKPVYGQVKEANLASNSQEIPRELDLKTEIENGKNAELKAPEKFRDSLVSYPSQIPNAQLGVVCFDGVILDITDRRQTEEILRERESYYRCIVETASEGVWMFDSESKTTFANSRKCRGDRSLNLLTTILRKLPIFTCSDDAKVSGNATIFSLLAEMALTCGRSSLRHRCLMSTANFLGFCG